jgi:hypothetical protein
MRVSRTIPALAAVAVGGALALGGCGGGDSTTSDSGTPASQVSTDGTDDAMKHDDAMKDETGAMKDDEGAMKHEDAMKDDDAMKHEGDAMKDETEHDGAMKDE